MLDRFRLLRKTSRVTLGYDKVLATTLTLEYTQARIGYRALTFRINFTQAPLMKYPRVQPIAGDRCQGTRSGM